MTPTFYFINSMRTISSITEKTIGTEKSMATFLANEINATEVGITGIPAYTKFLSKLCFLKDKIMQCI